MSEIQDIVAEALKKANDEARDEAVNDVKYKVSRIFEHQKAIKKSTDRILELKKEIKEIEIPEALTLEL